MNHHTDEHNTPSEAHATSGSTGKPLHPESHDPVSVPFGVGGVGLGAEPSMEPAADPYGPAGHSAGRGFLLVVLLAAIAGGTLYAMRVTASAKVRAVASTVDEAKVTDALKRLTGGKTNASGELAAIFADTDDVLIRFIHDPTKKHVDLANLQMNPFELRLVRKAPAEDAQPAKPKGPDPNELLRAELAKLKLQSILVGNPSLAVINGQVVRDGDQVGSFVVTAVNRGGVELAANGNTYTLTMEKP